MAAGKQRSSKLREQTFQHSFESSLGDRYTIPLRLDDQIDPLKEIRDILRGELKNLSVDERMEDKIWMLDIDNCAEYTRYFINDNPSNLNVKFSQESRKLSRLRKFGNRGIED